jgi:hypothetical protein
MIYNTERMQTMTRHVDLDSSRKIKNLGMVYTGILSLDILASLDATGPVSADHKDGSCFACRVWETK